MSRPNSPAAQDYLDAVAMGGNPTTAEVARKLGVSPEVAARELTRLVLKGRLDQSEGEGGVRWALPPWSARRREATRKAKGEMDSRPRAPDETGQAALAPNPEPSSPRPSGGGEAASPAASPGALSKRAIRAPYARRNARRRNRGLVETRLTILRALADRPRSLAAHVASMLGVAPQNARQHLRALEGAGLAESEDMARRGGWCPTCGGPTLGRVVWTVTPKGAETLAAVTERLAALELLTASTGGT